MKLRRTFTYALLAFSALLVLCYAYWLQSHGEIHRYEGGKVRSEIPLKIDKFSLTSYDKDRLTARLSAGLVVVMPHRFEIFRIRSVNRLVMKDARIEAYFHQRDDKENIEGEVFSAAMMKNNFGSDLLGRIVEVRMEPVEVLLFVEGVPSSRLVAQSAKSNPKTKELEFLDAKLVDLNTEREISSRLMKWNRSDKRFDIPGEYFGTTSRGRVRGRGLAISPDFSLTKITEKK
ncbi:MAG: hypothetical protein C0618_09580 [Desulfuromonas sp.]|nr:MAG: hypothetical protein C0618_09580 [Desulfuromonas sp.]